MGLNTKHDKTNDICYGFNETKQVSFRFELLNNEDTRGFEAAQGIEFYKITKAIKINGYCDFSIKDKLNIFGKTYFISTIGKTFDNILESQYSSNVDNFTGSTILGLE